MYKPAYTRQFEKDIKKLIKSGKNKEKIKKVMTALITEENLELNIAIITFLEILKIEENAT